MNLSGFQEQRAKNMIWNAASDYHFLPDYAAYDRNGEPSFYFNCIIGYVHRYYDYALLEDLLLRLGRLREANLYPVSYTHLDVYKRQASSLSAMPSRNTPASPCTKRIFFMLFLRALL